MTGDIESIGEAVTAGLAGAAVEPGHGGMARTDSARCLNCGTSLAGSHCHHCGQKSHVHRSFVGIGHDLLHAVLHFDGKFWNTLPLLIWRPGDLTRRYIHGERASFISPLALFLFSVFLTYAVLASVGMGESNFDAGTEAERQQALNGARISMREELKEIDARMAKARATNAPVAAIQAERNAVIATARTLGIADDRTDPPSISDTAQRNFSAVNGVRISMREELVKIDARIAEAKAANAPFAAIQARRDATIATARTLGIVDDSTDPPSISDKTQRNFSIGNISTGVPFIDAGIKKANENPSLLIYKLQANAYKFAWALIPLSMPFLWLLYPFSRRFHMFDHFVFVTYSISFMLLWFVALRLAGYLPEPIVGMLTAIGIPYVAFHMYRQLRGAYRSSRLGAAARTFLLLTFCIFTVTLFLLLLLAMGIMG